MTIVRSLVLLAASGFAGVAAMPVSFFLFDASLASSFLIGIGIPAAVWLPMGTKFLWARTKTFDPYREEAAYVKHQVKEARKGLRIISSCRFKVRSAALWIKLSRLYKLAKSIVSIVDDEPMRYKDVQLFFTQYLPSTVTLVDRYTFLLKQPATSPELKQSLRETERLLDDMIRHYQHTLLHTLSNDVLSLDIERKMLEQTFREEKQLLAARPERAD